MTPARHVLVAGAAAVVSLVLCLASGCSNSSSGGGGGSLTLVVMSTAFSRSTPSTRTACTVTVNGSGQTGSCFTPYSVSAYFSQAGLASTTGGLPVRLLGGGDTLHGFDDIFRKEFMDLRAVPNIDSDDNIQDGTASSYNLVTFATKSIETVFQATASGSYYHVRTFFVDQPPSTASAFSGCGLTTSETTQMDTKGTLYTGLSPHRGDIMVCVKATATETCEASDYKWVDGGVLVGTRTGTVAQLTGAHLVSADTCTPSGDHPDMNWGGLELSFGLTTPAIISATIAGGVKTYSVTSAGSTTTGTKLKATVDVDLADSLFAPTSTGITDLSAASDAAILNNIDQIMLKSVFVENTKSSPSSADAAAVSAALTLELIP